MTDDLLLADLEALDEEFMEVAPVEYVGSNNIPDGTYQAKIDRLYFDRAKKTQNLMALWELIVVNGPHKDATLTRRNMLQSPKNLEFFKGDLEKAGLKTDGVKMSDLPAMFESLLDVILEVRVARSGTGDDAKTNVYINRRVDVDGGGNGNDAADAGKVVNPRTTPTATNSRTSSTASKGLSKF